MPQAGFLCNTASERRLLQHRNGRATKEVSAAANVGETNRRQP